MTLWKLVLFAVVPWLTLTSAIVYTVYFCYRWRDWRPLLFVIVLLAMAIHQTNEIITVVETGTQAIVGGFGEYPETTANVSASIAVVLVLRIVSRERDLRERLQEQLQRERELKERQRKLEQFAYAASHDLREPLRVISNYLQLLERRYADDLDDDAKTYVDYAVRAADRMQDMIEGLLTYSRVGQRDQEFEAIDTNEVLAEARSNLEIAIERSRAEITAEELPTVEGDPNQLLTLFQNLLDNAITYSGDDPPRIHVSVVETGRDWEFTVADDGIGMDPERADRAFDLFERLHTDDEGDQQEDGTGLGLALAEQIVNRHGGEIWIDTEPGEGTEVHFTIPRIDDGKM